MIPRFALARPRSLDEAFAAFEVADGDGWYVAGGTELLQVMKMGLAEFGTLIDLKGIPELHGIELTSDGWLRVGAASTHRDIEHSSVVQQQAPGLAALERRIANPRVRNVGTIGGNLAFAEPHSDPATFLLACDAMIELAGRGGQRSLGVDEFIMGPLETAREPSEVMLAVRLPPAAAGEGRAYAKIAFHERPAASVAVRLRVVDQAIAAAVVSVGSVADTPAHAPAAARALAGAPVEGDGLATALARAAEAVREVPAGDDLDGSADYKRHLAGVLLRRAVRAALQEATAHG